MATILVTDAGIASAIAIIRSLGAAGHRVVAADTTSASPGFRSRYVSYRVVHPRGSVDPAGFIDAVRRAVARHTVDLIFPVTEEHTLPLAGVAGEIGCALAMPDVAAVELMRDKRRSVQLATDLGIPTPETVPVENPEHARAVAVQLGWPVVVKPRYSRVMDAAGRLHALEVTYANSIEELDQRVGPLLALGDVLLQRYHAGEGYGVELLLSRGEPLAVFEHHRLHEVPVTGGASSYRESVPVDPLLHEYSLRLLGELEWSGLAMVEFRVGGDGARFLEVNGRVWGSLPLAVKSGVDFPAQYVDLLLGGQVSRATPAASYRIGVRSHNLRLELVWLASVLAGRRPYPYLPAPHRAAAIRGLLDLLRPSEHDILSLKDPRPGFVDLFQSVGHLKDKVIGRA